MIRSYCVLPPDDSSGTLGAVAEVVMFRVKLLVDAGKPALEQFSIAAPQHQRVRG